VSVTIPITHLTEKQRRSFSCGVTALDDYFKRFAKPNHLKNIGKTFVLLEEDGFVLGFYTTSMGSIEFLALPQYLRERLPKYPIPIARIARLAVSSKRQRQGWGEFLLVDALNRIRNAASFVAAFAVVVDAKDETARAFYIKFGFVPFEDHSLCLFLLMDSIPN
jgi:ribosomal protein S18 acetylase RimI-like enzyme